MSSATCSSDGSGPGGGSCSTSRGWRTPPRRRWRASRSRPCDRSDRPSRGLSGGQRQAVAVAKSVMWNSLELILDEPTAALGVAQTRQVLDLVRRLAEKDLGRRDHLSQPPRRVRGGRPDHGAAPRAAGGLARTIRRRPRKRSCTPSPRASSTTCPGWPAPEPTKDDRARFGDEPRRRGRRPSVGAPGRPGSTGGPGRVALGVPLPLVAEGPSGRSGVSAHRGRDS